MMTHVSIAFLFVYFIRYMLLVSRACGYRSLCVKVSGIRTGDTLIFPCLYIFRGGGDVSWAPVSFVSQWVEKVQNGARTPTSW